MPKLTVASTSTGTTSTEPLTFQCSRKQDSPHAWTKPDYGAKQQLTLSITDSHNLEASEKLRIQEIVGTLLYYGRAVDMTQLVTLESIASAQSTGTEKTMDAVVQLLNCRPATLMPKSAIAPASCTFGDTVMHLTYPNFCKLCNLQAMTDPSLGCRSLQKKNYQIFGSRSKEINGIR